MSRNRYLELARELQQAKQLSQSKSKRNTPARSLSQAPIVRSMSDMQFLEQLSTTSKKSFALTGGGSHRKVRSTEVHYLSFEGGGGKGFVYAGALAALEARQILTFTGSGQSKRLNPQGQIKGVSGSSAGAMTAFLVSIGYSAQDITGVFRTLNMNTLVETPRFPRSIVTGNGCIVAPDQPLFIQMLQQQTGLTGFITSQVASQLVVDNSVPATPAEQSQDILPKLMNNKFVSANNVFQDFGIAAGCSAINEFNRMARDRGATSNMTFRQHSDMFRIKLVVTGTNIETGRTFYFSSETTPNMPVVMAVRISMSFPFIFKPVRIDAAMARSFAASTSIANSLAGLYIDGGLKDNIPVRVFENAAEPKPHTLGLRLDVSSNNRRNINDFGSFLAGMISTSLDGETHVDPSSGYAEQCIELDTTGLETTNFNPSPSVVSARITAAQQVVDQYFR